MEFENKLQLKGNNVTKKQANNLFLPNKPARRKVTVDSDNKSFYHKMDVNFYAMPPFGEISLDEAEQFADERLKLLLVFEDIKAKSVPSNLKDYIPYVTSKLDSVPSKDGENFFTAVNNKNSNLDSTLITYRRRDHISHFLLRLYFCRSEELRKKFTALESEFLRFRLLNVNFNDTVKLAEFIRQYHFNFEAVENDDMKKLLHEQKLEFLYKAAEHTLFKLPFEEALDTISRRRAYLHDGYAYISSSDMISIIVHKFQLELVQSLASLSLRLCELDEERRLVPLIENLYKVSLQQKRVIDATTRNSAFSVTPDMLDDLSKESFPPCMRHIHETLRKNHHLKHYGRLHYGLFLKNIGLSLDDAINFFREEFIQKITPERFQRDYAYNIRYNYGKEGKKVNLSAFSCGKIISGCVPQAGDTHGCPFRHFDSQNLRNLLKQYGIGEHEMDEILAIVEEKNYTNACTKYYEVKHGRPIQNEGGIYHPNQFYRESRRTLVSCSVNLRDSQETNCETEEVKESETEEVKESKTEEVKESETEEVKESETEEVKEGETEEVKEEEVVHMETPESTSQLLEEVSNNV